MNLPIISKNIPGLTRVKLRIIKDLYKASSTLGSLKNGLNIVDNRNDNISSITEEISNIKLETDEKTVDLKDGIKEGKLTTSSNAIERLTEDTLTISHQANISPKINSEKTLKNIYEVDGTNQWKRKKLEDILIASTIDHKVKILKEPSLKDAHIYCKINKLSGQITGPLIEHYIIIKNMLIKNNASSCKGDCSKNGKNIEIKVSLGGEKTHKEYNYVQLRLNHDIDYYLFTAYYLDHKTINQCGKLYIFAIYKSYLKELIAKYGQYAHGTKQKNGTITIEDLNQYNNVKEYCLRPKYGDDCWNALMQFSINDIDEMSI
jgi:hypothetical protein